VDSAKYRVVAHLPGQASVGFGPNPCLGGITDSIIPVFVALGMLESKVSDCPVMCIVRLSPGEYDRWSNWSQISQENGKKCRVIDYERPFLFRVLQ